MQIKPVGKMTIQFWLLLKNNYPLLTDIRAHMTRRKHFHNFEKTLFAVEADCLNFVEHLIAFQEHLMLVLHHFNVIYNVIIPEDFGIIINISNPEKD